jgi:hypothetical protein
MKISLDNIEQFNFLWIVLNNPRAHVAPYHKMFNLKGKENPL